MKYRVGFALAGLLVAGAPAGAFAQGTLAFVAVQSDLRAGPAPDYPVVAVLARGVQVGVQGCVPDYTWCDVIVGPNRGWLYAGNIQYPYQSSMVPLSTYGGLLGIGVLGFAVTDYWGQHYRSRPFYRERERWADRPQFHAPHIQHPRPSPAVPLRGDAPRLPSVVPAEREHRDWDRGQRREGHEHRGEEGRERREERQGREDRQGHEEHRR